ncbi:MAG: hypothetical protein WBL40_09060, partial [Terrimicrobiaceae bacterium]
MHAEIIAMQMPIPCENAKLDLFAIFIYCLFFGLEFVVSNRESFSVQSSVAAPGLGWVKVPGSCDCAPCANQIPRLLASQTVFFLRLSFSDHLLLLFSTNIDTCDSTGLAENSLKFFTS